MDADFYMNHLEGEKDFCSLPNGELFYNLVVP